VRNVSAEDRDTARELSALVGALAALEGDAAHWLTDPEYAALRKPPGVCARSG
jgi:hypothetical protein